MGFNRPVIMRQLKYSYCSPHHRPTGRRLWCDNNGRVTIASQVCRGRETTSNLSLDFSHALIPFSTLLSLLSFPVQPTLRLTLSGSHCSAAATELFSKHVSSWVQRKTIACATVQMNVVEEELVTMLHPPITNLHAGALPDNQSVTGCMPPPPRRWWWWWTGCGRIL